MTTLVVDRPQHFECINPAFPGARWRIYRVRPWWEVHDECWLVSRLIYAATGLLTMASIAVTIILNN